MGKIIIANWKMNPPTIAEAEDLFGKIAKGIEGIKNSEVIICPPSVYIATFQKFKNLAVKLGAQDAFWEEKGPYTGEVSPEMLKSLGIEYIILGHSERRRNLRETDDMINKKIKKSLELNLCPIFCVGDSKRESKEDIKEIESQLLRGLYGLDKDSLKKIIITYEPVWAISTTEGGVAASPEDAEEGVDFIRETLTNLFGKNCIEEVRIIYGGSVNSKNVKNFISKEKIQGVLVGAASLDAEDFINIVKNAEDQIN